MLLPSTTDTAAATRLASRPVVFNPAGTFASVAGTTTAFASVAGGTTRTATENTKIARPGRLTNPPTRASG